MQSLASGRPGTGLIREIPMSSATLADGTGPGLSFQKHLKSGYEVKKKITH